MPVKSYTNVFNNCLILTETTTFDIPYYKELKIYIIFFFKKNSNIFCKECKECKDSLHHTPKETKRKTMVHCKNIKLVKHICRITWRFVKFWYLHLKQQYSFFFFFCSLDGNISFFFFNFIFRSKCLVLFATSKARYHLVCIGMWKHSVMIVKVQIILPRFEVF